MAPLVALPPDKVTGVPKLFPSILKRTFPVGAPAPGATGLTVAVNVTDWPNTEGLAEEITAVAVSALFTVWVKGEAVLSLPLKLPSPLYTAVTEWLPVASEDMAPLVAAPPDKLTGRPKSAPSILNCTVPVGVPDPGAVALTVAVNVTDWP